MDKTKPQSNLRDYPMHLRKIIINNLRTLKGSHTFHPKPLTILVGANSTGKSTFLRMFPLLKQSIETVTRGPILWFGRYVDFGSFKTAATRDQESKGIKFTFNVFVPKSDNLSGLISARFRQNLSDTEVTVSLVVKQASESLSSYTDSIVIKLHDTSIEYRANPSGIVQAVLVNGAPVELEATEITFRMVDSLFGVTLQRSLNGITAENLFRISQHEGNSLYKKRVYSALKPLFHGNTSEFLLREIYSLVGFMSRQDLYTFFEKQFELRNLSTSHLKNNDSNSIHFHYLHEIILADQSADILNSIDEFICSLLSNVTYIAPSRDSAQRYYRFTDVGVNEIHPQGSNLAMYLNSLSEQEISQFSNWCAEMTGLTPTIHIEGLHASILLKEGSSPAFNIADMGYGYSQLLPVLASLWISKKNSIAERLSRRRRPFRLNQKRETIISGIVTIEQPELHLHPKLQAAVGRTLVAMISEKDFRDGLQVICETHSEVIINEIGRLVSEGIVDPQNVQILIFENNNEQGITEIKTSTFNQDGSLSGWPYGFFSPSIDVGIN